MPPHDHTHPWPELPYAAWKDTYATLHLWTQIVGKVRLKLTPWLNHSWHVTFYVDARGLTTGAMPLAGRDLEIAFDFIDHVLWLRTSDGETRRIGLAPMPVAEFYAGVMHALAGLGVDVRIDDLPNEIEGAIPFGEDRVHASYDRDFANRHFRVLASSARVLFHFRTGFIGKASPVHFFWGSFDLAVTRFSGRARAAAHEPHAGPAGRGRLRGLFARGIERGLLAGRRADRLSGVLFLRLSGAGGFCAGRGAAEGGVLFQGLRPVHPAV